MRKLILALVVFLFSVNFAVAANCFWVGGTGSWTPSNATSWASATGGTPGTCGAAGGVPGTSISDTATFDAASGGGTVTINYGGTVTIGTLTMGAFTGTWDNSVNNNDFIINATFSLGGSGTRTFNLGTATYTITTANGQFSLNTVTNLTCNCGSATIAITGNNLRNFNLGSATIGRLNVAGSLGGMLVFNTTGSARINTLDVTAPNTIFFTASNTLTITNALNWTGTPSNNILLGVSESSSPGGTATITFSSSGNTMSWGTVQDIIASGNSLTCNNCITGRNNTNVTINNPAASGGGFLFGG